MVNEQTQLTAGDLKAMLRRIPDETPIYFRRIAPLCGNIEGAYSMELSEVSSFGVASPCLIFEPCKD